MRTRLLKLWDTLRTSYWFVPALMMVLASMFWGMTSSIDRHLSVREGVPLEWLYYDEIDAMRTLVLTVVGLTVGVIGVVYSITMIPLTIAASQFGPRLLRNFLRDRGTHVTLGTFSATIVFCLLVLLQLRDTTARPQVSVNVVLLLGLCTFLMLVYFINHIAVSIQASHLVAEESDELLRAIDRELEPAGLDPAAVPELVLMEPTSAFCTVLATSSGYLQMRDDEGLLDLARDQDLVIRMLCEPGDFVVAGAPLARVWPAATLAGEVDDHINSACFLGVQRTLMQDVTFGINELVEVAIRALSPAINDPFTAMTCLDWLGAALCRFCGKAFPPAYRLDEEGRLRLLFSPITFSQMADAAFNQIRDYGHSSAAVTLRLMHTLEVVSSCARTPEQRRSLLHHAARTEQGSQTGLLDAFSREQVSAYYRKLAQLLETPSGDTKG